jgi:hypothetical protein
MKRRKKVSFFGGPSAELESAVNENRDLARHSDTWGEFPATKFWNHLHQDDARCGNDKPTNL